MILNLRYVLRTIGILIIWIVNLPIYLYRLLKAKFNGDPLPPFRSIFVIPQAVDRWLSVIGICFIVFLIIIAPYFNHPPK